MEEELIFPRIVYHLTEGNKTDYGYRWRQVNTLREYQEMSLLGWALTPSELGDTNGSFNTTPPTAQNVSEEMPSLPVAKRGRPKKGA